MSFKALIYAHQRDGFEAARAGRAENQNPWKPGTVGHSAWAFGWKCGHVASPGVAEEFGKRLAALVNAIPWISAQIRAHYAKKFGVCRSCEAPLGGPSPSQICEPCHAAEVLAASLGGSAGGDA